MTAALVLLAGCWLACVVAFLVGAATAPLMDDLAGDRWTR